MGFPIHITQRCSTLHYGSMVLRIDMNPLHARQVNHNPVIAERLPGYVVATTAHRNQ
jgi:hypothetical protein